MNNHMVKYRIEIEFSFYILLSNDLNVLREASIREKIDTQLDATLMRALISVFLKFFAVVKVLEIADDSNKIGR